MKKTILFIITTVAGLTLKSQTVDEGNRHLYYERYASAENTFQNVLEKDIENEAAWYGLVRALSLQEKDQQAAQVVYNAPPAVKDEPLFMAANGYALMGLNKKDSAKILFDEALDKTKHKNVGVLLAVAQAQVENKNGDLALAHELIEKALKKDKNNPAIHVLSGDAYLKQGNGSSAYEAYNKALGYNSNYAAANHKLGLIFLAQKSKNLYLDYFSKAVGSDAAYAPSLYQLYAYHFYYDPAQAMNYFNQYLAASDSTIQREYDLADMEYLNKDYTKALSTAGHILEVQKEKAKPRIFKLMAYSYAGLQDSAMASNYMHQYFTTEADSNFLAKDFELMADLSKAAGTDSSNYYIMKAIALVKEPEAKYDYYKRLSNNAKAEKDYASQALWLEKYYTGNDKATNVDLFNWGLAHYLSSDYKKADSVFGVYVGKYPEQSFGYYWQARANVALDKDMKDGLAVPYYNKLVEVLAKDTSNSNYKKWMAEAFGYMAAYEANTQKDYKEAIGYFEKVLEVDPENESAKKYISILEKDIQSQQGDSK